MQPCPEPGTVLAGRYRLIRVLGEGGMGVVMEAENTGTGRRVAVKWLHAGVASNPEAVTRLMREATAACRVRHPNIVDVYDVVHDGGSVFLVMELLEGEPLETVLRRGGIPLHQLVALVLPAMRGVAEAHRLGVIHRDIHPANIFLCTQPHDPRPVAKVLDFGISKLGAADGPSLTQSGTTLGTPLYMSFEQLCSARDVDQRTDVYSFGVVLYEALTGRPPFEGDSFAELAVKIATATPVPPKELRPDIPTALDRIILWAMARNRDDRVPNLETLVRELEPFASEHAFRGQMTDAERALPSVVPRLDRAYVNEVPAIPPAPSIPAPPLSERKVDTQGKLRSPLARSMLAAGGAPGQRSRLARWSALGVALVVLLVLSAIGLNMRRGPAKDLASTDPAPAVPALQELPVTSPAKPASSASAEDSPRELPPSAPALDSPVKGMPSGREDPEPVSSLPSPGHVKPDLAASPAPGKSNRPGRAQRQEPSERAPDERHDTRPKLDPKDPTRAGHAYLEDFR